MNSTRLKEMGVASENLGLATRAIQCAVEAGDRGKEAAKKLAEVIATPESYLEDAIFGAFARAQIEARDFKPPEPIEYRTWGSEIDTACHAQMRAACALPMARGAALMPDAHVGYGLPIGGVLALEGAVVPYAVGVDIACRMKLSVLDVPVADMDKKFHKFKEAIEGGTRFGLDCAHERPQQHAVMDQDWTVSRITRERKDRAWKQLGTSGSGNHFVEFGVVTFEEKDPELGLEPGEYVGLLSHSGSRGTGAAVCDVYSGIARRMLPKRYEELGQLAWLPLDTPEGQEYWNAMNLMGDYAAANHDVIHRLVSKLLGAKIISGVENHHNFAWKEIHDGRELIVHRKGATPAGEGVLGVIPGSMADPAYVVRGLGKAESLKSASHGAGRKMSRTQARSKFNWKATQKNLEARGIRVLSAGADEVPGVYKNIDNVMAEQRDLVRVVARFDPKIVKMSEDKRAED